MSEAETASRDDRLPWLGEEAEPQQDHRTRDAIGLAIVAALLIFGVSYWIASQSWQRGRAEQEAATAPQVAAPLPKEPVKQHAAVNPQHHHAVSEQKVAANKPAKPAAKAKPVAVAENAAPKAKPAAAVPKVALATVRIGAFTSPGQAKIGWHQMVRAYPALAHLPAVVVDASGFSKKPVYRFEIATASQANSDVLCQRMSRIQLSCGAVTR
jgi:hypothetical protein